VKLDCSDIDAAGIKEIGASEFAGLYSDDSDAGNKPGGTVPFTSEPSSVAVFFGTASGQHDIEFKGKSKTTYKKYGKDEDGDPLEELFLQSVTLTGALTP
jgi:hypothetical protein